MKAEINIPSSLNEIRLDQYQKYLKLINDNEPSEFVNQKTIEIFCGLELSEIAKINYHSVGEIFEDITKVFEKKPKLIQRFEIGGKEFGFIPNMDEMTYGEFTDLETYINDPENWHKAMAVLYRPTKNKIKDLYEIEEYQGSGKYSGVMKYAPLDVVLGSIVFFYDLMNELRNDILDCLQGMEIPQGIKDTLILLQSTDGMEHTTLYQEGMFFNSKLYLN